MYLFFLISFPSASVVVLVKSVGPTRFFLSDGEGILKEQNAKKKVLNSFEELSKYMMFHLYLLQYQTVVTDLILRHIHQISQSSF